jgi:hypothetical protein
MKTKLILLCALLAMSAWAQNAVKRDLGCPTVSSGSATTYACNIAVNPTAYVVGETYYFVADVANTTSGGNPTINFNGIAAKKIVKVQGAITTELVANDIRVGQVVVMRYDGTNMQMTSPLGNAPAGVTNGHVVAVVLTCAGTNSSTTAEVCNTSPTFTPVAGDTIIYQPITANTSTYTLNVNSLGAKAVTKRGMNALIAGDIAASPFQVLVTYDGIQWEMHNGANQVAYTGAANTFTAIQTFNNPILAAYGNASSVSYGFTGTNGGRTGMFTTGADVVKFAGGGSSMLSISVNQMNLRDSWNGLGYTLGVNADNFGLSGNSNRAGGPLIIQPEASTGSASAGYLSLRVAPSGTSGVSVNPFIEVVRILATGKIGFGPLNTASTSTLDITDKTATIGATLVTIGLGAADSATTATFVNAGTTKSAGYQSSDGSAGATVTTCTGYKNGLCVSGS